MEDGVGLQGWLRERRGDGVGIDAGILPVGERKKTRYFQAEKSRRETGADGVRGREM